MWIVTVRKQGKAGIWFTVNYWTRFKYLSAVCMCLWRNRLSSEGGPTVYEYNVPKEERYCFKLKPILWGPTHCCLMSRSRTLSIVLSFISNSAQLCRFLRNSEGNTIDLRYESNRLMLCTGLWWRYINMTITILGIIHRPVYYLKHVSETRFCLRLQVETTQIGPIDRASVCLRTPATTQIGFIKPTTQHNTNHQYELAFPHFQSPKLWGLSSIYTRCFMNNIVKSKILSEQQKSSLKTHIFHVRHQY
jgi:hypothetical protein